MATDLIPSPERIADLFLSADNADIMAWADWYADAYDIAGSLAERYGVTREQAAGVIAATSPLNSWGANVRLAERVIATRNFSSGYLGTGLRKCERILAGEDILTVLHSDKISNFYLAIISAGEHDVAVIDRHAFDITVGVRHNDDTRPTIGKRRYAEVAKAYSDAADLIASRVGVRFGASIVQSVTWVAHRRLYWSAGAWA